MGSIAEWLALAVAVEDVALRMLKERYPDHPVMTNVEYYTAAVLQGIEVLPSDLFPATFAVARTVGWTAHVLEQAAVDKLHPARRALHRTIGTQPAEHLKQPAEHPSTLARARRT